MANNRTWRPQPLRSERSARASKNAFPTAGDGVMTSSTPVAPSPTTQRANDRGSHHDAEYCRVWETSTEPEEAAVHDFWWDTSF